MTATALHNQWVIALFAALLAIPIGAVEEPEAGWPRVCRQMELLKAIRIIDGACKELDSSHKCDHRELKKLDDEIDRAQLLAALKNPYLQSQHFFFHASEYEIEQMIDWKHQEGALQSLRYLGDPENSVIYVIGQASTTPPRDRSIDSHEYNFALSEKRMNGIMNYLENRLKVKCHAFRGGWLGDDIFQLTRADAGRMNISPSEYEDNDKTLNQAVHVFVFPCASLLTRGR